MSTVKLSMALVGQVVGLAAFLCGLWLLAGAAWVLLAGGLLIAAVGGLWEAGKL